MASSYSTDLKLELMVTGENAGTWGDKTNTNLNLVQQAIAGVEGITLTDAGVVALTMSDAALSTARNMVIKFNTITLNSASQCTIPDGIEKFYIFDCTNITNPTNLTIKTVTGTGFALTDAKIYAAYSDGTNISEISLNTLGGTIAAADLTGTIATSQIADDAITTAKISANQVTSEKIADDAVGPDQLSNTAVTAGSYTSTSLTVDAQGRITAASSGAAGAGGFVPIAQKNGPTSSNHTFNPGTNYALSYLYAPAGGGGAGYGGAPSNQFPTAFGTGGTGGTGGFGGYFGPVTGGDTLAFNISAGGAGGNTTPQVGNPGSAGGTVTFTNIGTVNGGNGGGAQPQYGGGNANGSNGNSGSAPGATLTYPQQNQYVGGNSDFAAGGNGGRCGQSSSQARPGNTGGSGKIFIFENFGS